MADSQSKAVVEAMFAYHQRDKERLTVLIERLESKTQVQLLTTEEETAALDEVRGQNMQIVIAHMFNALLKKNPSLRATVV